MSMRGILLITGLSLLLVGCGGDDDNNNGASEQQRAEAAASASVITGSLNNPDDPGDDDGGDGSVPTGMMVGGASFPMNHCSSGIHESGTDEAADVGSPYTDVVDLSWNEYDNCVQEISGSDEWETDGYSATGIGGANSSVTYSRWSAAQGDAVDLNNQFTWSWPEGDWRFSGEVHNCDDCGSYLFANEAFLSWEIEAQGQTVTFRYGEAGDYFVTTGTGQDGGQVEQELNGLIGLDWEGAPSGNPCDFEVDYETVSPLIINEYGTSSQVVASGQLEMTMSGGTTYNVEYQDGDIYLDGQLVDPDEPNPCEGAFDLLEFSA